MTHGLIDETGEKSLASNEESVQKSGPAGMAPAQGRIVVNSHGIHG
jgi:hypothetical protein